MNDNSEINNTIDEIRVALSLREDLPKMSILQHLQNRNNGLCYFSLSKLKFIYE